MTIKVKRSISVQWIIIYTKPGEINEAHDGYSKMSSFET